jgi:hypothetical protein
MRTLLLFAFAFLMLPAVAGDKTEVSGPPEKLEALQWMVGTWQHQSEGAKLEMVTKWSEDQRFLLRSFEIKLGTSIEMTIRQTIFWDPVLKKVRSWGFSSDGSYEMAVWEVEGKKTHVHREITHADGVQGTASNAWEQTGAKDCLFTSTLRKVRGKPGPDFAPMELERK